MPDNHQNAGFIAKFMRCARYRSDGPQSVTLHLQLCACVFVGVDALTPFQSRCATRAAPFFLTHPYSPFVAKPDPVIFCLCGRGLIQFSGQTIDISRIGCIFFVAIYSLLSGSPSTCWSGRGPRGSTSWRPTASSPAAPSPPSPPPGRPTGTSVQELFGRYLMIQLET